MFTADSREALRSELIERAKADARITGVAITGSGSVGNLDKWSDIDLAFGVAGEIEPVLQDFSDHMYAARRALHHLDVHSGNWIYRVFLLSDTLQVDLAFAPASDFGPRAPTFKLVSGNAIEGTNATPLKATDLVGFGWLYALHVRSSIARGKPWQAEYMVSSMRDQVLALACLRHGLPTKEARGIDQLPDAIKKPIEDALVRSLDTEELTRAFRAATKALLNETGQVDQDLASRLEATLLELTSLP